MAKGLTKIDGKTYIFNLSSGEMYTGWVTYKGKKYYLKSNGEAETEWAEIGSHTYYFDPVTCAMAKGFYKVKKKLHYFNSNGEEQFGWITVNGKKYYLDEWGVVQFGWHTVSGKKYYFDCTGVPVTGNVSIDGTIYKFDKNGVLQGKVAVGTTAADKTIVKGKYVSGGSTSGSSTSSQTSSTTKKTGKTGWEKKNGKWYYYKNGTLQKEDSGLGIDITFAAHRNSYFSEKTWGKYDVLGFKGGNATIKLKLKTQKFYASQYMFIDELIGNFA